MSPQKIVAIIGSMLLIVGVFLPIVSLPFVGNLNLYTSGHGDGEAVLVIAAISAILVFLDRLSWLWIPGLSSLGITAVDVFRLNQAIVEQKDKLDVTLHDNPFKALADLTLAAVQVQWGWAVLAIGGCLILAVAFFPERSVEEFVDPDESTSAASMRIWGLGIPVIALLVAVVVFLNSGRIRTHQVLAGLDAEKNAGQVLPEPPIRKPQFGYEDMHWDALSHTAIAITGDIVTSSNSLRIAGKTYPLTLIRVLGDSELQAVEPIFNVNGIAPENVFLRTLYKTDIRAGETFMNDNSICGPEDLKWVLFFGDTTELERLQVAFFDSKEEPRWGTDSSCATFSYTIGK